MPQATEEERAWARGKFGSIDDWPIVDWLEKNGYKLLKGFTWITIKTVNERTPDEIRAINFLIDEWDYGGLNEIRRS